MAPRFNNPVPKAVTLEQNSAKPDRPAQHVVTAPESSINVCSIINAQINF
jgi:hypothetical protein